VSRVGRYANPFLTVAFTGEPPAGSSATIVCLETEDRAACTAALWLPAGERPKTAVAVMHPRADFLRHYAVPGLLASVGNDSMLIHEQILLDVAAGIRRLRELGFERVVLLGNSGGGSLYTFYLAQAGVRAAQRLTTTAAGDPFDLGRFDMPMADAVVYLAAHPGEGLFLLHCIDPSVTDESDPLSCDPDLDMYDPRNGFRQPPQAAHYDETFLTRYRHAQRERVERIDARALRLVAERREARAAVATDAAGKSMADDPQRASRGAASRVDATLALRKATAVRFMNVYRTEADPRYVDLGIDRSARDYGSLFGRRPDVINYGPFGFARVVTPEAWLSTWSAISSRASIPANAAAVNLPALVVGYDADNAVFPSESRLIFDGLGSSDKAALTVAGDHYGQPSPSSDVPGRERAIAEIVTWLRDHGW
jgi:hypothetical protein